MQPVNLLGWTLSMAANIWLLLVIAPRIGDARARKWALIGFAAVWLITPAIILGVFLPGFDPPDWFGTRLFQLVFSCIVMSMMLLGSTIFHGMVDTVIAFHETHNRSNLHRFPVSFLIAHRARFKKVATRIFCVGAGLMFYGIWTDLRV